MRFHDYAAPAGTAIVTGAAGGIGKAVTRRLAEAGSRVVAVDCEAETLDAMAQEARRHGLPVDPYTADITDASAIRALISDAEARSGPIEHLVNAAGILRLGESCTFSDEDWADTFSVNVTGTVLITRSVVSRMIDRGRGSVVTVASNAAFTPRTGMAAYAASKAAVAMFTRCLGLEVARYGVRCNVIAPGSTETQMLISMWRDESDRLATLRGQNDTYRLGIPLGRLAQPADVAEAVTFLLSDHASHITMQTLTVDGGAALGV